MKIAGSIQPMFYIRCFLICINFICNIVCQFTKIFNFRAECQKFNLTLEISEIWSEAENLNKEFVNLWSILLDYNEGKYFVYELFFCLSIVFFLYLESN